MIDPRSLKPKLPPLKLFIGGRFVDPAEGGTLEVLNPATGKKICDAPAGGAKDVDLAVRAARAAFDEGPWGKMKPSERAKRIRRLSELLLGRLEEFALIESMNNGKTFKEAIGGDVRPAARALAYWSEWANKTFGEVLPVGGPFLTYTLREPVGVVGAIIPWNYPSCQAAWKLGPALAAGCTVVLKPSELTPLTALKLAELTLEADFPEGVINVVTGYGDRAGEAIARHGGVDKVAFTGSIRTARRLLHASADTNLKKLSLELGGKSPQILFPDANFDAAVDACFWGIFANKGEICNAGSRILIHQSAYEDFVGRLKAKAEKMIVGDPLDPKTEMGSQISAHQLKTILGYIQSAREQGAKLVAGGERDTQGEKANGFFVRPTIFGEVGTAMKIAQEEVFGPVLACMRFADEEEALKIANGTSYGLAAAVWTGDVAKGHLLAQKLKAGVVWLNCFDEWDDSAPFGGYKESGWGRDQSHHALSNYTQIKAVWTKLPEA